MKRTIAVLAILIASVVSSAPAVAQGKFLDFGKATAGIVVFGAVACTATRALLSSGLPFCTSAQYQQGVPFAERHMHLLTPQVQERFVIIERERVVVASRTRHITGARHNTDGTCTQSNGRKGEVRGNECFVPD